MKTPCDEAVIGSRVASSPCGRETGAWVLAATILASSMAFIDSTVVNVALPALQMNFGATVADMQWVVESYGLTLAALILVGGSMGDLFGRRLMFLLGVVVFAIASLICGIATSLHQLIFARAIQGIGAAFLVPGSLALISASFEEKDRGRAIGTWSGSTAITTAIGPVLGGWLIQHLSWRWAFFVNLPLAVAVIAISVWRVPESRSSQQRQIDWWGALAATLCLSGLVFGLIESATPWLETPVGCGKPCRRCSLHGWVSADRGKAASPMVPLSLFRSRAFSRRKSAHFLLVRSDWNFLFSASTRSDPSAGLLGNRRRGRSLAFDPAHVPVVALVGRIGRALRSATAARSSDR